ncbi:hypothetical protein JXA80_01825 [bacterium]|nr:hypothetical protein [candidate division CSSED10-310 bacterium]
MTRSMPIRYKHPLRIAVLILVTSVFVGVPGIHGRVWRVCMACDDGDVQTLGEALLKAEPRDTILVVWEPSFPYAIESIVINKPVRIISHPAAGDITDYDLFPVLTSTRSPIVRITVPGVELIGFNVMYLEKPAVPDDDAEYAGRVGIHLEAPALIRYCAVTNCSAAVVAAYSHPPSSATGSRIEHCRIGIPGDHGLDRENMKHSLNLYGLVLLGHPGWTDGCDRITGNQIMRNRRTGVVYTPQNKPCMSDNLVELNGDGPFRIARRQPNSEDRLHWIIESQATP